MRLSIRQRGGLCSFASIAALCATGFFPAIAAPGAATSTSSERATKSLPRGAVYLAAEERQSLSPMQLPASFERRDDIYEGPFGLREAQVVRLLGGPCTTPMYQLAWDAAEMAHVPPPVVAAVIEAESGCRGEVVSSAGARGLMQLIPEYGGREGYRYLFGRDHRPSKKDLRDPRINIELGASYIGVLQSHYYFINSRPARSVLALAAYNAGPDLVDRHLPANRAQSWDGPAALEWVLGNTPAETRGYVRIVLCKASLYERAIVAMHVSDVRQARVLTKP